MRRRDLKLSAPGVGISDCLVSLERDADPSPIEAPARESSPGGSCGTTPRGNFIGLRRSRSGFRGRTDGRKDGRTQSRLRAPSTSSEWRLSGHVIMPAHANVFG
jgi:hypothetical protein